MTKNNGARIDASLHEELSVAQGHVIRVCAGAYMHDAEVASAAVRELGQLAERLACHELAAWCSGKARRFAVEDLEGLFSMLPALLELWEQSQAALVTRAYPRHAPRP